MTCPLSIKRRAILLSILAVLMPPQVVAAQPPSTITVFAAASLTDTMKTIAQAYRNKTGVTVVVSVGASSMLAHQIAQGARADVFMSADTDWMDYLQKAGLIANATRKDLLGNQLVLIAASPAQRIPPIGPHFDLAGALGDGKLALADPSSVPAGKYAKAALTALGVWQSVAAKLAPAENVRVALEYVARGDAPLGIVYATDAKAAPNVHVVGVFAQNTHPPIVYPVALTKTAAPAARAFLDYLSGPEAKAVFEQAGFSVR